MNVLLQQPNRDGGISRAELVCAALDGKLRAIGGYDDILWKIRGGFAAVLFGALSLIIGKEAALLTAQDRSAALFATLVLVIGFSVSACVIDAVYLAKKLKVVVTRDALVRPALADTVEDAQTLEALCRIAGETPVIQLPDSARAEYWKKIRSAVCWELLPLYLSAPLCGAIICGALWA